MPDDFKIKVIYDGDASGAVKAAEQAKAAIGGVQQAAAPAGSAAAAAASPEAESPVVQETAAAQEASAAHADLAKDMADSAAAAASAHAKISGLTALISLFDPLTARVIAMSIALRRSLGELVEGASGWIGKLGRAMPAILAVGTAAALGLLKQFADGIVETMRKAYEEEEKKRMAAKEQRQAAREEAAKLGMRGDAAQRVAGRGRYLESIGFDRATASRAAALGVEGGATDQQLIQIAAAVEGGQLDTGKTRRERMRNMQRLFSRTLRGGEGAEVNRAIAEATAAGRTEELDAEMRAEKQRVDTANTQWSIGAWARKWFAAPKKGPLSGFGFQPAEEANTQPAERERQRVQQTVHNVYVMGNQINAAPPKAERRMEASED